MLIDNCAKEAHKHVEKVFGVLGRKFDLVVFISIAVARDALWFEEVNVILKDFWYCLVTHKVNFRRLQPRLELPNLYPLISLQQIQNHLVFLGAGFVTFVLDRVDDSQEVKHVF